MAFSSTMKKSDIQGTTKVQYYDFDSAGVTTGVISTGLAGILHVSVCNKTTAAAAGKPAVDGGDVTLSGLTADDVGTVKVEGF